MAEIKRIVRSDPISQFRQVAPQGGGMFATIADLANTAYDWLAPAAEKAMGEAGAEHGRELARQAVGQNRPLSLTASTMGGISPHDAKGQTAAAEASFAALSASWGEPLKVNSAYRDPEHNARVGGARNSQHTHGNAYDVDVSHYSREQRLDLIRQARAAGFRGVGVYDNALHFDVGPDRSWGPSYGRDSLPSWAAEAVGAPVGGRPVERMSSQGGPEPVTVQTREGKVEPRLYSPLAGPILQAFNAAAQTAYNAETLNQAAVDLFDLSSQFQMDPEGFSGAAKGYIDQIVGNAPQQFRSALRGNLETRVQQRFLGMVEERQRDTKQRAINASGALMDRYQSELAEAIASGDEGAIAAAQANLDDVLVGREALPGLAWTPAQSENIRIGARDAADREIQRRAKEVADDVKGQLERIIDARENGMVSADEAILSDPTVQALHPELVNEANAWVQFSDAFPSFNAATAEQRAEAIVFLKSRPVTNDADIAIVKAAEQRNSQITKDWAEDPVMAAEKYLPVPPPKLPSPDDPRFTEALRARRAYSDWLVETGRTAENAIFSDAEAKTLGAALSVATPPEMRLALASQLVTGLGRQAVRGFKELGSADPVTRYMGMFIARGGDAGVALEAMNGQTLLAENQAQLPPKADRIASFDADMAAAISVLPNPAQVQTDVMQVAQAIYASRARGLDPNSEAANEVMKGAVQSALGQTEGRRGLLGGVQEVSGHQTLLPPTVSGKDLDEALRRAVAPQTSGGIMGAIELTAGAIVGADMSYGSAAWEAATAVDSQPPSAPYVAGAALPRSAVTNDQVRFVPVSGSVYRMEVVAQGAIVPVEAADGKTLLVDVDKLIQATR